MELKLVRLFLYSAFDLTCLHVVWHKKTRSTYTCEVIYSTLHVCETTHGIDEMCFRLVRGSGCPSRSRQIFKILQRATVIVDCNYPVLWTTKYPTQRRELAA